MEHIVYEESDIDAKLGKFNGVINELMDKHAPLVTVTLKQSSQPWITKDIRKLMKKRDRLRSKYLRTNYPDDHECFRVLRNKIKQMIRSAKAKFMYSKLASNNSKTIWSTVRSLNIAPSSQQSNPVVSVDDLNKHYASVASVKYPDEVSECIGRYIDITENKEINDKFHFKYVLPQDIVNAITSIKSNSKGADLIPVAFLKLCVPALLPVLDHLFNFSLQNSSFPRVWKMANILPIPKVKNPQQAKDYRPVSILCVLGKALEKIVHKQVCEYLHDKELFPEFQSGFRQGHSTATGLLKVTDDIRGAMDRRLMTLLVLLDLSKAFDCVHHDLLLTKLKYFGFSDAVVGWFSSYLLNRSHRVFISDDLFSEWADIVTGVPQGSVLGPLLFLLYLIDLPQVLHYCLHHAYADDLELYIHFSLDSFDEHLQHMLTDIAGAIGYCNSHNLLLNVDKTQAIIIGTQRYLTKLNELGMSPLRINDCVIPYSSSVNNLGVIFDPTLNWNEHCIFVAQKVFGILAQLRRSFSFIPPNIRKLLVSSLIFPVFDYASVVFTDMSAGNNLKLQRLQNACIRFISGIKVYDHVTPVYKSLDLLKIEERRTLAVAMLVWKIVKTQLPYYLFHSYVFTSSSNARTTRSSKQMMQIPNHRLVKYNKSFHVQSAKIWNEFKL